MPLETQEKRTSNRRRTLKGAKIAFSGRSVTVPCVMKDLSDNGAKLKVQNVFDVPDKFELFVELDGMEVPCQIVWRAGKEVGVRFTAAPVVGVPSKTQVVCNPNSEPKPSLLRHHPIRVEEPVHIDTPPVEIAKPTANFWVFVAEDDPDDQMLLSDAFSESGYNGALKFFSDGQELIEFFHADEFREYQETPGIVILDLNMPRLDGRETLKLLKTEPGTRKIPVVILTTSNADDDVEDTFEWGVSLYLTKPSSFGALKELVDTLKVYWSVGAHMPTRTRNQLGLKETA